MIPILQLRALFVDLPLGGGKGTLEYLCHSIKLGHQKYPLPVVCRQHERDQRSLEQPGTCKHYPDHQSIGARIHDYDYKN